MATSPGTHVQSAFDAQLVLRRDDRPAAHLSATQAPAGIGAGVASVTVTLIPVVQLWVVRRSHATVPHCRAAGLAPTRFGMLAQSLTLASLWSTGWRSDHWKYTSSMVHPRPPPVPFSRRSGSGTEAPLEGVRARTNRAAAGR